MERYNRARRQSNPIRPRVARREALRSLATAPAAAVHPFAAGLARPAVAARVRAPKGGATIRGHFYRGGSFLPDAATVAPATDIDPTAFAAPIAPTPEPSPARFAINGFTYTAREVPAGACGSVAFELYRGDTNHHYHVVRDRWGLVTCDCPDYLSRCEGTASLCKHGSKLVELGLVPAATPIASTLGHREFITPTCSVLREGPAPRPRRFEPSPEDNAVAAELFAEMAGASY